MAKCRFCGCTDGHGCPGGCYWVGPNICSFCVMGIPGIEKELKVYMDDPDVKEIIVTIKNEDKTEKKFIVLKKGK